MDGLYGAVEAGGTKFVCMVGTGPDDMREQTRFPTTSPDATLRETIAFFRSAESTLGKVAAVGIASFGPVDVQSASPTFGFITSTPKAGWANVDIAGALRNAFDVPIGFDTDVNAAALAEWRWGAAQALDTFLYLTIGTGIGGGGMVNGRLMHGLVHPEMGHVRIPHDLDDRSASPASVRFTATASRAWPAVRRWPRDGCSLPSSFRPAIPDGRSRRTTSPSRW